MITISHRVARQRENIMLAFAMNRRFRWLTPAELHYCARGAPEGCQAVYDQALQELIAAGAVRAGKLHVNGWELPMLGATTLDDGLVEQARQHLSRHIQLGRARGELVDEKGAYPRIQIPAALASLETAPG